MAFSPRNTTVQLLSPVPLLLAASVIFLSIVVAYSAWVWRLTLAERMASERDGMDLGPDAEPGGGLAGD